MITFKDTRVIMKVADAWEGSSETSSSQFMATLNKTLQSGMQIQIHDATVRLI